MLLLGRFLGGISTSILFSSFESWMVHEHHAGSFPDDWLSLTFSMATSGNGIVAILSGIVGSFAVDHFGPVAPFDLSAMLLISGGIFIAFQWKDNYGDVDVNLIGTLSNAVKAFRTDRKVVYLGLNQSLFEGAM